MTVQIFENKHRFLKTLLKFWFKFQLISNYYKILLPYQCTLFRTHLQSISFNNSFKTPTHTASSYETPCSSYIVSAQHPTKLIPAHRIQRELHILALLLSLWQHALDRVYNCQGDTLPKSAERLLGLGLVAVASFSKDDGKWKAIIS